MAGRFPLFTDADIRGQLIEGLIQRGWDVVRVIDVFPERTRDPVLFVHAAKEARVFVTTDRRIQTTAERWLKEGRPFRMVTWKQDHHARMSDGDLIQAFEEMAEEEEPFAYPIRHIKPKCPSGKHA